MIKKKSLRNMLMRREKKRFFHKMRIKLRRKLCRNGKVPRYQIIKYKLRNTSLYERIGRYHNCTPQVFEIKIPRVFSFIEAPRETIVFFEKVKKKLNRTVPYDLHILHEDCNTIDLAASSIFDTLIKEDEAYWRKLRVRIRLSGRVSNVSKHVNNFLLSFGLLSDLGILNANFTTKEIDYDYGDKYLTYKVRGSKRKGYLAGTASLGLVTYFDRCFRHNNLTIVKEMQYNLAGIIGEIIGNAEEHSGDQQGRWFSLGCYNKEKRECSFAIINLGLSIYETLSDVQSTASEVIDRITEVVKGNRNIYERVKGRVFEKHLEEPIWNVMALQDGISSRRTQSGTGHTHGHGIMDVLAFIDAVKSSENGAQISIVSGYSAVVIDYEYPIIEKAVGPDKEKRRILAFNHKGDLKHPPDERKVFSLPNKFGGTVFAGRFKIDEKYLIGRMEQRDERGKN